MSVADSYAYAMMHLAYHGMNLSSWCVSTIYFHRQNIQGNGVGAGHQSYTSLSKVENTTLIYTDVEIGEDQYKNGKSVRNDVVWIHLDRWNKRKWTCG